VAALVHGGDRRKLINRRSPVWISATFALGPIVRASITAAVSAVQIARSIAPEGKETVRMMRSILMVTILILAASAIAWAGDKEDCLNNDGTMRKAQQERMLSACQSLADEGDPLGQNNLGLMYLNGLGVSQDYAEAAKMFRKAADQGFADAQINLGGMCLKPEMNSPRY
jgi:TPR repeat protein